MEGGTTVAVFEACVSQVPAPALRPGQVVVLDDLAAHHGERVHEVVEAAGCELAFGRPTRPTSRPSRRPSPR